MRYAPFLNISSGMDSDFIIIALMIYLYTSTLSDSESSVLYPSRTCSHRP